MGQFFSAPIAWDAGFTINIDTQNHMTIGATTGPITGMALGKGFLVYRPDTSSGASTGSLELVFQPGQWTPDTTQQGPAPSIVKFFDKLRWTELPPGRLVYSGLPQSTIKGGLHQLLLNAFTAYTANHAQIHPALLFILPADPKKPSLLVNTLLVQLLSIWNTTSDPGERAQQVDNEIDAALDIFLANSAKDTFKGLQILKDDTLFSLTGADLSIGLEIRNLYGEPLNPHFYLRRLGDDPAGNPTELAPVPPFPAQVSPPSDPTNPPPPDPTAPPDPGDPPARTSDANGLIFTRIPQQGGVQFDLMQHFQSRLLWNYTFDATTSSWTVNTQPRAGASVDPHPITDKTAAVQAIWTAWYPWINKYAQVFQIPCELIVAAIIVEARAQDIHSIRLEPLSEAPYPADYQALLMQAGTSGSTLTQAVIDAYWQGAGGWKTNEAGLGADPKNRPITKLPGKKSPSVNPAMPFDASKPLASQAGLNAITWTQLAEMFTVQSNLVTPNAITLPALAKTKGNKYLYDLLKNAAALGPAAQTAADIYWSNVGGLRLNQTTGTEDMKPDAKLQVTPVFPFNPDDHVPQLADNPNTPTQWITWGQLVQILAILKDGSSGTNIKVPAVNYALQPLGSAGNYLYTDLYARPQLVTKLGITADQAADIVGRYTGLSGIDVVFTDGVGPNNVPGVQALNNPSPSSYLTLTELKAFSEIFPGRISIGIGQVLFDTIGRFIIPWIKKHYGKSFFQIVGSGVNPPDTPGACIPWAWDNIWDNVELQILLLAGYLKRNSVFFWNPADQTTDQEVEKYRIGERMTMFDFPRVFAAYNAGAVRIPQKQFRSSPDPSNPDSDWGLLTAGTYFDVARSGLSAAVKLFASFNANDSQRAMVRLRPDINDGTGMESR